MFSIVWLVTDDARLRPCRNGNDEACGVIAIALLESAGRFDAAKEASLWACDADRSWRARAAQERLAWTPTERKRPSTAGGRLTAR